MRDNRARATTTTDSRQDLDTVSLNDMPLHAVESAEEKSLHAVESSEQTDEEDQTEYNTDMEKNIEDGSDMIPVLYTDEDIYNTTEALSRLQVIQNEKGKEIYQNLITV